MKYIVYLTINKINLKIYIGVHGTENPDVFDHYLGNGVYDNSPKTYQKGKELFHAAVRKYGVSAFYRTTLKVCESKQEALKLEKTIVNEDFIKRTDTYNVALGGGNPPILSKTVYQFDKKGNLIKEWKSQVEIYTFYKISKDVICGCIYKKRDFDNSYWSFEKSIDIKDYRNSANPYTIYQYNSNGELLNTFKNAKEASQKLDLNQKSLVSAVNDRIKLQECYFLRKEDNIEEVLSKKSNIKNGYKPVFRYKLNGDFDEEFESQSDACRKCSLRIGSLSRAIKNNRAYKGYKWSYIKDKKYNNYKELSPVRIAQYDLDHNLIKIFDSVTECKKQFPSVQKVCRHERKQTKGFIFEYIS